MHLTDEPGNWFKSEATGTPLLSAVSTLSEVAFLAGDHNHINPFGKQKFLRRDQLEFHPIVRHPARPLTCPR